MYQIVADNTAGAFAINPANGQITVANAAFQLGDTKGILTGKLLNGFVFSAEDVVIIK